MFFTKYIRISLSCNLLKYITVLTMFLLTNCTETNSNQNLNIFENNPKVKIGKKSTKPLNNQKQIKSTQFNITNTQDGVIKSRSQVTNYNKKPNNQPNNQQRGEKVKIAAFLPISGKYKEISNSLVNSLTMSLFEANNQNIELVVFDSTEDPLKATENFAKIVAQNIKIVIGPLLSQLIPAIAEIATTNEMLVFSLSNNSAMLNLNGENAAIFLCGITPEMQFNTMLNFAKKRGYEGLSYLLPKNDAGKIIGSALEKVASNLELKIISREFYLNNLSDLNRKVDIVNKQYENHNAKQAPDSLANNNLLIIADNVRSSAKIARYFNDDGRKFQIVASNQLDDITSFNYPQLYGSWFTSEDSAKFKEFERDYQNYFNQFPAKINFTAYNILNTIAKTVEIKSINGAKSKNQGQLKQKTIFSPVIFSPVDFRINSGSRLENTAKDFVLQVPYKFNNDGSLAKNLEIIEIGRGINTKIN